jgi:hypothetical protein
MSGERLLYVRLSAPDNLHSEVRVYSAVAHLASQARRVDSDLLSGPALQVGHVQYVTLDVLRDGGVCKSTKLLQLGVFGP